MLDWVTSPALDFQCSFLQLLSIMGYAGDWEFSINYVCGNLGTRLDEIGAGRLVCVRSSCSPLKPWGRFKGALILAISVWRLHIEFDLLEYEAVPYFMPVAILELSLLCCTSSGAKNIALFRRCPFIRQ